jgi:hypothetical protein
MADAFECKSTKSILWIDIKAENKEFVVSINGRNHHYQIPLPGCERTETVKFVGECECHRTNLLFGNSQVPVFHKHISIQNSEPLRSENTNRFTDISHFFQKRAREN